MCHITPPRAFVGPEYSPIVYSLYRSIMSVVESAMRCIKGMLQHLIGFSGACLHFIRPVLLDVMIIVVEMAFRDYVFAPYILAEWSANNRVSHCVSERDSSPDVYRRMQAFCSLSLPC